MAVLTPGEAKRMTSDLRDQIQEATRQLRAIENEPGANRTEQRLFERATEELTGHVAELTTAYAQAQADEQEANMAYTTAWMDRLQRKHDVEQLVEAYRQYLMRTPQADWPKGDWDGKQAA